MKIIYRVYEKTEDVADSWMHHDTILNQEVCICNSREHFKEIMRSMYGDNIAFKNSKKLAIGTPYVIIISEDCYDAEQYVVAQNYTCSCCNKEFLTVPRRLLRITSTWHLDKICHELLIERESEIHDMVFCCEKCKSEKLKQLEEEFTKYAEDKDIVPDVWVDRSTFGSDYGYIYRITKRSTGEFYIGQTKYAPIFRWGQHLTTERFPIKNIDDYIFEVIEIIDYRHSEELSLREAYWINHERDKFPDKCLNNQIPDEEEWKEKIKMLS